MPELATLKTCTGCGACYNICPHEAISIRPDDSGFLMPVVDSARCVECGLCEKACPIVNGKDLKHAEFNTAYALWDKDTRTASSSGGAFSAIARRVLELEGVVFGAAWNENLECRHIKCTSRHELGALRGSKYLQSDIRRTYVEAREALREGKHVLFTGTPCQIAGLRSFLFKPYDRLITVEIVCHGVPSHTLFKNYIEKLSALYPGKGRITEFTFRNLRGWGYAPSAKISEGKTIRLTGVANLYMVAFDKAATFRESCYECRFNGTRRVADITIADFWGIGRQGVAFHHDVTKGVSLVIPNTQRGHELISGLEDCFIEQRPVQEAIPYNHNLVGSCSRPACRSALVDAFNNPQMSLSDINTTFKLVRRNIKSIVRDGLIKTGLFWSAKSIINKIRSI